MSRYSPPALILVTILVGAALTAGVTAQTTTTASPTGSFTHNGPLTLASGPGQQLHGTTSLDAGAEVTVRIQSENKSSPFLARPTATVDENGEFTVTQDLSNLAVGSTFTATLRHDGTALAETTGQVVECSTECGATETETQRETGTDEIGVQSATVRRGESVRVPITVGDHDTVSLTIGDETDAFGFEATLTDGNDDGRVTVALDTTAVGEREHVVYPVDDQDRVHIRAERGTDDGVPRGSYDVALSPNESAPVADTGTVEVTEREQFSTDEPGFAEAVVTVRQDRSVEIPVSVGDRDRATLVIGGQGVNYWLNATLVDGDGDGRVIAVLDAWAAGREAPALTVAGEDDRVSVDSETTLGDTIAPVEYDMRLYRSDDHDDAISVGTLSVRDADIQPVTTAAPEVQSVATANRGQSAEIRVSVGDRDNVSLTVGDDTDGFGLEATLTDGNDDGRVTVDLDTTASDASGNIVRPNDRQDQVHVRAERGTDDGIPVGSYDVEIAHNESAPVIDTGTLEVTERAMFANDEPGFAESVVTVRQDQSAEILVSVGDRDRAALVIGDEDTNYRLNATLVDGDGDGRVRAVFDAGAAGSDAPTLTATDGDDQVSIDAETTVDTVEATEYAMNLHRSDDYGDMIAVGTISVRDAVETETADGGSTTSETPETTVTTQAETTTTADTAVTQSDTTTVAVTATTENQSTTAGEGPGFGALGALVGGALALGSGLVRANRD